MKQTTAIAHPNFALIKYWGKKESKQNRPAMSSISITVDSMWSKTTIKKNTASKNHRLFINGKEESDLSRILPSIEYLSKISKSDDYLLVQSENNFPTASGLASSASGVASFVTAYDAHYNIDLKMSDRIEACILGSGSAPRSLIGGFVFMDHNEDYKCNQILKKSDWPLDVLICIASINPKTTSSRVGMEISRETSPMYQKWLDINNEHINSALKSLKEKNLVDLAKVTEENCELMHKVMESSIPSIHYRNDLTHDCIAETMNLRASGHSLFYTIDAGPQVKIICEPKSSEFIKKRIMEETDINEIIHTRIGESPRVINEN